jgi:Na+/citrate or Na+/malate symporter
MMKRILTKEPLRWFLLLWIATVVVGALLGSNPITIIRNIMRQLQSGVVLNHSSILLFLHISARI